MLRMGMGLGRLSLMSSSSSQTEPLVWAFCDDEAPIRLGIYFDRSQQSRWGSWGCSSGERDAPFTIFMLCCFFGITFNPTLGNHFHFHCLSLETICTDMQLNEVIRGQLRKPGPDAYPMPATTILWPYVRAGGCWLELLALLLCLSSLFFFFVNCFIWPGLLFLVTLLFLPRGRKVGYRHIPLRASTPNILATTL